MDTLAKSETVACAAFEDVRQLEMAYSALIRAGWSPLDVSVLVTEEAYVERPPARGGSGILNQLAPVQGGFTGGIQMKALGPARSFGASGSVAGGLMAAGIDDAEAAWIMNLLAEGHAVIIAHGDPEADVGQAQDVFDKHGGRRFVVPVLAQVAARAGASARRALDRPQTHPD